ncbi:hypothetical protein [Lysinibacillus capsici]|uniref:hypothetical protein n=1 Tax=Lysinibacillus capsici TaxID=2115968 RepID=UPI000E208873|nr:hypothetical protein [Lysinibacillus capsici]RDV27112.1 hypothetical protein C7B89_19945 [Lysinibacillus capsici]
MTSYTLGNRIFYDSGTGAKLWETGEVSVSTLPVAHQEIVDQITYVDLEVSSYDPTKYFIASINPETKEPVFEMYPVPEPTEEQKQITQLQEDILLLKTDSEVGGIL